MYIPKEIKVRIRHEYEGSYNDDYDDYDDDDYEEDEPEVSTVNKATTPLAYITYCDEKGKLRKATSWTNWGDELLGDFSNAPQTGFKLESIEKRSAEWFGSGRTMFRIIHPQEFIFEITSDNLYNIATQSSIIKGVIDDECVLVWNGAELTLIPCSTKLYKEYSANTTKINEGHIKPTDLVIGQPYEDRNGNFSGYYIGKRPVISIKSKWGNIGEYGNHRLVTFTITYKPIHIFAQCNNWVNTETSPKVFIAKKPPKYDKIATIADFGSRGNKDNYLIPDELTGKLDKEKIEKFAKSNAHAWGSDKKEFIYKWETFPDTL